MIGIRLRTERHRYAERWADQSIVFVVANNRGVPEGLGEGLGAVELCVVVAPPGLDPLGFCGAPGGTGPGTGGALGEPPGADCATAMPPLMMPMIAPAMATMCMYFMPACLRMHVPK
jgi:hypothetical protein